MRKRLYIFNKKGLTVTLVAVFFFALPAAYGQDLANKLSPGLALVSRNDATERFMLVVSDPDDFCEKVTRERWPLSILRRYDPGGIVVLETSRDVLTERLLPMDEVQYIDRGRASVREELPVPGHNLFTNSIHALQAVYPDWNGEGRTISVMEKRFDSTDVDLRGRVAPLHKAAQEVTIHASVMATLIAGAGTSNPAGQGAAWGCRLASSDFVALLPDSESDYAALDVSVQNHSYGVGIENYYGADAMAYDQSVRSRPSLVHVFSAGNSGGESAPAGVYRNIPGFANLTGSFKMAKNVLLAGAVDSFGRVVPYSSRGPAYDGRVKPDLVAFGPDGSSGSAALVSGTAAVLQQAFAERHGGNLPQASLVRAILINSADDVEAPGPDFSSGFGNMNALRAAKTVDENRFFTAQVALFQEFWQEIVVPPGQAELKITLAWDDPPAAAGTARALTNDLDLKLLGPDGQSVWLPWVLNIYPHPDSLQKGAIRGVDSLNNVEQITLDFPEPGIYKIRVFGRRIVGASQPFSIAFEWRQADSFQWVFPLRGNTPVSGEAAVLHWESTWETGSGILTYRYTGDTAWTPVDSFVTLSAGYYRWTPPDTFALVQLRMQVAGQFFPGDTFLLAPVLRLRVGFNCTDSLLLFWNAAGEGSAYRVWGLGDRYLEPVLMTADTQLILDKSVFPFPNFAVTPVAGAGFSGLRSGAPDIATQGVACYFRNLLANLNADNAVDVSCLLGSTHSIQSVRLEKLSGGAFSKLGHWDQPAGQLLFSAVDTDPLSGINLYRAVLEADNGGLISSDTAVVYFAGAGEYLVFPNPVSGRSVLHIIAQSIDEDTRFVLFDVLGRQLAEMPMNDSLLAVPLSGLSPGVYPYAIRHGGRVVFSGKVLVDN